MYGEEEDRKRSLSEVQVEETNDLKYWISCNRQKVESIKGRITEKKEKRKYLEDLLHDSIILAIANSEAQRKFDYLNGTF